MHNDELKSPEPRVYKPISKIYDNEFHCIELLKKGVECQKYNYGNDRYSNSLNPIVIMLLLFGYKVSICTGNM